MKETAQCDSATMTVEYANGVVPVGTRSERTQTGRSRWIAMGGRDDAEGIHLFHYRTQKLSPYTSKVLGWKWPGRIGSCWFYKRPLQLWSGLLLLYWDKIKFMDKTVQCDSIAMTVEYVNGVVPVGTRRERTQTGRSRWIAMDGRDDARGSTCSTTEHRS